MAPGAPIVVRPSSPDDGRIGEGWDMDLEMVLSAACSLAWMRKEPGMAAKVWSKDERLRVGASLDPEGSTMPASTEGWHASLRCTLQSRDLRHHQPRPASGASMSGVQIHASS